MKSFRQARVTWVSDSTYLGNRTSPMTANVHISGNAAVVDAPYLDGDGQPIAGEGLERVERLLDVAVSEGGKGKEAYTEVTGRSEFLKQMGLHPNDQSVTIRVKGGKCLTC